MDRRGFGKVLFAGAASAGLAAAGTVAAETTAPASVIPGLKVIRNDKIRLGGQRGFGSGPVTSIENMNWHLRWGIKHLDVSLENRRQAPGVVPEPTEPEGKPRVALGMGGGRMSPTGRWNLEAMMRVRDTLGEAGLAWESIRMDSAYIAMTAGPERNRYLDLICENMRTAGRAGITIISYHWNLTPIRRNLEIPGRGGSSYSSFKLEKDWQNLPLTPAGRVTSDEYWERLSVWAKAVVPAAIESKVRLACHPYDPGGLPIGYLGVDNFNADDFVAGMLRYEKLYDSPNHGFQYDTGVSRESMPQGMDQLTLLHGLLQRKKVHQIHFRNVRGGQNDFAEVYHDEGDVNMFNVIRLLRDMDWEGSLLPDHSPAHPDDRGSNMGYAFANGYILGLIRAAREEAILATKA
jgi:mannonate dehydratase